MSDSKKGGLKGQLHWYHWLVVTLSLILTFTAWYVTSQQVQQKSKVQFEYQSDQIIELVQDRMAKYEEALWAGVSALHMFPGIVSRENWKDFASSFQVASRFPGIDGIGVIHYVPPEKLQAYLEWQRQDAPYYAIHPSHDQKEYWPITYIEPQASNEKAVGLDMAHESNRYTAAMKARDTGQGQITAPITLVQDAQKKPGFLFYVPWYSEGQTPAVYGDLQRDFLGLVYAPFIVYKLMDGTLANTNRQVNFSIYDGADELYNELNTRSEDYDPDPMFSKEVTLQMYGRPWQFTVQSSTIFRDQQDASQPLMILIGGLLIDALLLAIFIILARANKRAVDYADEVTEDLQLRKSDLEQAQRYLKERNSALEEANRELDQFAFVASHDLKAPLRGVSQLAQWIEEDLDAKMTPQTTEYMGLLKSRIVRLERLLDDLLSYSRVGRKDGGMETFIVADRVQELFLLQSPPPGFELVCEDAVGDITTLSAPFDQIIRNLLGNAIKHHDQTAGVITVRAKEVEGGYEVEVEDDGPGIPTEHQQRVFELFHTLKPRDEVEGSGLGLSIIKKILDRYGCQYSLESEGQRGACFRFTWPNEQHLEALLNSRSSG